MSKAHENRLDQSTALVGDVRSIWAILEITVLAASSSTEARPIKAVSGTYGRNSGAPGANATRDFAHQCEGKETCWYILDKARIDNPAAGCRREFHDEWRCTDTEFPTGAFSPEEGAGRTLVLSCVEETGAGR
jgi:hypothetical protein